MTPRSHGVPRPPLPPMPGNADSVRAQRVRAIIAVVMSTVRDADEDLVRRVVTQACPPKGPARLIALDLFDEPTLLTSGSSHCVRSTRALINDLADLDVPGVVRPRCELCGGTKRLKIRIASGGMACEECWKETKFEPCTCCMRPGFMTFRSASGQGICGECRRRAACRSWWADQERIAHEPGPGRALVRSPHGHGDSVCQMCEQMRYTLVLIDGMYFMCERCVQLYTNVAAPTRAHCQSRFRRGQAALKHHPPYCDICDRWKKAGGIDPTGLVLCDNCWKNRHHQPCTDCGKKLSPAPQAPNSQPVCKFCWYLRSLPACDKCEKPVRPSRKRQATQPTICTQCRDRVPARRCIRCSWLSKELTDGPHGPACIGCVDVAQQTFDELGAGTTQVTPGMATAATSDDDPCQRCGRRVRISTRRTGERICRICATRAQLVCKRCGHPREHTRHEGPSTCPCCRSTEEVSCERCRRNLFALLPSRDQDRCLYCRTRSWLNTQLGTHDDRPIGPQLRQFIDQLATVEDLPQLRQWFSRAPVASMLKSMANGHMPIEHATLDAAAGTSTGRAISIEHLRRLLVTSGVLPPREEYMSRLERACATLLQHVPTPDRFILNRYIQWHVLPGVRRRLTAGRDPESTCGLARNALRAPQRFIDALHRDDLTLATTTQPALERWMADHPADVTSLSVFLRWAARNRLVPTLDLPTQRMNEPMEFNDPDQHWDLLRRCLHDQNLSHRTRLAGTLVLMYGQSASSIVRLRASHVQQGPPTTLQLGKGAVEITEPIATMLREIAEGSASTIRENGLARVFEPEHDRWLFPGRGPGKPLGTQALLIELRRAGIHTRSARNTTLLTLARDVPPMILADLLGIGTSTADRWRQWSGGAWAAYNIEVDGQPANSPQ